MIKFVSLFSGSAGNSYFINIDNTKILVDVGMSRVKIAEELKKIGEDLSQIDAIFITHEHTDHIRGLSVINNKHDIPIYMNAKTFECIKETFKKFKDENVNIFENNEFIFNDIKVLPFSVPHDAVDPVGFSFFDKDGKKITIVTDLGEITTEVYENIRGSDILVLEANYDDHLIRFSPYPLKVINRIVSPKGHLSNSKSTDLLAHLVDEGLENIALGHISRSNNNSEIVYQIASEKINLEKFQNENFNLEILQQDNFSGEIVLK